MNSASPAQILAFAKAVSDSQRAREPHEAQDSDSQFSQELKRSMGAEKSEKPEFRVDPKPVDKPADKPADKPVDQPEAQNNENTEAPAQPAQVNTQNNTANPDTAAQLAAAQIISQTVAAVVEQPLTLADVDVNTLQISAESPACDPLDQLLKSGLPLIAPTANAGDADAVETQLPNNTMLNELFAALPASDDVANDPRATAQTVLDLLAAEGKPVDRAQAAVNDAKQLDLSLLGIDDEAEAIQLPAAPERKPQNQQAHAQNSTNSAPVQPAPQAHLPEKSDDGDQPGERREKSDAPTPIIDRQSPVSLTLSPTAASVDLNAGASIQQAAASPNLDGARKPEVGAIAAVTAGATENVITAPVSPQANQPQIRIDPAPLSQAGAAANADPGNAVEKAVANQVSRGLMHVNEAGQRVLTIRLTPPELGTVRVDVIERSGAVTAHLHAEDDGVRVALERFLPQIRQDLRSHDAPIRDIVLANPYNNNANNPNRGFFGQNKQRAPADGPVFAIDGVRDTPAILAARELGGHADASGVNALV